MAEVSKAVSELAVSGYHITLRTTSKHVSKHPCCDDKVGMGYYQVSKEGQASGLKRLLHLVPVTCLLVYSAP